MAQDKAAQSGEVEGAGPPASEPREAQEARVEQVEQPEFWRALCPELRISDRPLQRGGAGRRKRLDAAERERLVKQMGEEGYLQTPPLLARQRVRVLAQCVRRIADHGLPAPFALVYDEFWQAITDLGGAIEPVLGPGYQLLPDFWVWIVGPGYEASGWRPHRDLERPDTLAADGLPRLMTLWLALTDATPLNSCIYVLPTHLDPHLPEAPKELSIPPGAEPSVRALPAPAGSALGWNQYALHWGGATSRWAQEPRISMAMYVQRGDVPPFIDGALAPDAALPFAARLGMIGRMLLKYSYRYRYTPALLALCRRRVAWWKRTLG